MARLLVEIEEELKRDLKIRLIREGQTLKSWLTLMARAYVDGGIAPRAAPARTSRVSPPREAPKNAPPAPLAKPIESPSVEKPLPPKARRFDDYLD